MSARYWIAAVVGLVLAQSVVTTNIAGRTLPRQFGDDSYTVKGVGSADCGKMIDSVRQDRARWGDYFTNYASGFLTGANFVSLGRQQGNFNVGAGTSPEALLAAMEQYCGQHPLETVADALEDVYVQLSTRLRAANIEPIWPPSRRPE